MKEAIAIFVGDVLLGSFLLYLLIILIDLFRKHIYKIIPDEPSYIVIILIVVFVESVQRLYSLI